MRRTLTTLAAAALLSVSLGAPVVAQDEIPDPLNFRWASLAGNTAEGTTDGVFISGDGWVIDGVVTASGTFSHQPGGPAPQDLLSYGTWQADSLVSLDILGTSGPSAAGTLVMDVTMSPVGGEPFQTQITVNCNVPPAGLFTGLDEGVFFEMGGASFAPVLLPVVEGAGPPMMSIGVTTFNILEEPPAM